MMKFIHVPRFRVSDEHFLFSRIDTVQLRRSTIDLTPRQSLTPTPVPLSRGAQEWTTCHGCVHAHAKGYHLPRKSGSSYRSVAALRSSHLGVRG